MIGQTVSQVLGITLMVRSLEEAAGFLRKQGLLGAVTAESAGLDRGRTHGLGIRLQE